MEFDSEKMRDVPDKSFPSITLPFHCDCTSKDMLRKCHEHIRPAVGAKDSNYQYSLVDGSGTLMISALTFRMAVKKLTVDTQQLPPDIKC